MIPNTPHKFIIGVTILFIIILLFIQVDGQCQPSTNIHDMSYISYQVDPMTSHEMQLIPNVVVENETCITRHFPYPPGLYLNTTLWSLSASEFDSTHTTPYHVRFFKRLSGDESRLKIIISTSWRCEGQGVACRWELRLNQTFQCIPHPYMDVYNHPSTAYSTRETFTVYCDTWSYGGRSSLSSGWYDIELIASPMESFHGEKHQFPLGTQPHGTLPVQYRGAPTLGEEGEWPHVMQVIEEPITSNHSVFYDRSMHQGSSSQARHFTFTKYSNDTDLLITYFDNFRCQTSVYVNIYNRPASLSKDTCDFEVLIDGQSCQTPGPIRMSSKVTSYTDWSVGRTIMGVCQNIEIGTHNVTISSSGTGIPSVGFTSTSATLSIKEVESSAYGETLQSFTTSCQASTRLPLSVPCFPQLEPVHDCVVSCRSWTFTKPSSVTDEAGIRIEYYDNFSAQQNTQSLGFPCMPPLDSSWNNYCVNGNGWLSFEIIIDGESCVEPGPLKFDLREDRNFYLHQHGQTFVGFCRTIGNSTVNWSISQGDHLLQVKTGTITQNENDSQCRDCNYVCFSNCDAYFNPARPIVGSLNTVAFMNVEFFETRNETFCNSTLV